MKIHIVVEMAELVYGARLRFWSERGVGSNPILKP